MKENAPLLGGARMYAEFQMNNKVPKIFDPRKAPKENFTFTVKLKNFSKVCKMHNHETKVIMDPDLKQESVRRYRGTLATGDSSDHQSEDQLETRLINMIIKEVEQDYAQ